MEPLEILVIGGNPGILETVLRLINNHEGWRGTGASSRDEAIQLFMPGRFHLVLFGGNIPETIEEELDVLFTSLDPEIVLLKHYGGGSGLLFGEIRQALNK